MTEANDLSGGSSLENVEGINGSSSMLKLLNGKSVSEYMSQRLDAGTSKASGSEDNSDESMDEDSELESSSEDEDEVDGLDSSPAEAGIIQKITLKNFMCHDFFELELGPQLNFIIGRNGSGKSAILTGISVCLGAKASDTSRGSSIRELIKDGKEMARITIVLKNEGAEAIDPELYGSKIIIERVLRRNGTNSYSIKSERQKTISTKKSTLDGILYKFNITVDNPMAFLSQDKAREFLTSTTDRTKYEYFIAGSLIENILENYKETSRDIADVQKRLHHSKAQFKAIDKKYKLSMLIYNRFKESDYLRNILELLHGKAYWYNVMVYEKKIEGYKEKKRKATEELISLERELEVIEEATSNSGIKVAELESDLSNKTTRADHLKQQYSDTKEQRERIKAEGRQFEEEIGKLTSENRDLGKSIESHKLRIEQEEQYNRELGMSKENLSKELNMINEEVQSLGVQREQTRTQLSEMDNFDEHEEIKQISDSISNSKREIINLRQRRSNLQKSQSDKYIPWGSEINSVISRIEARKDWHQIPIGPIGLYIEVKNDYSEWKDLLNTVLSKTLDSFLVCDEHDRRILQEIFKQFKVNKNIIIRKFEKFNFDHGKARGGLTFLDIINIQNDTIFYTLVDVNNIEKQVITKDRGSANRLVEQQNVMSVFSLLSKRSGNRASKADNGSFRLDPVHYRNELHKFSSSASSHNDIISLDHQIEREQENLKKYEHRHRQTLIQLQNERQKLEKRVHALQTQMKNLSDRSFEIETKLNDTSDMSRSEALKAQIESEHQQITTNEGIIVSLRQDHEKVRQKSSSLKQDLERQKSALSIAIEELEVAKGELDSYKNEVISLSERKEHIDSRIGQLNDSMKQAEDKVSARQQELEPILEKAISKCSREEAAINMDVDSSESITKEYEDTQRKVRQAEEAVGRSFEEVQSELMENLSKRQAAESDLLDLSNTFQKLDGELSMRFDYLHTTIRKNVNEASSSFERSLALRGFKGELKFSFISRTLSLLAQTKNDEKKRTVESLSGGEKSFAQIALLLAIWKIMDTKIRGLDEFDVFMDSVNRSISIKLLLSELRQYPKSQSLFITPQDITMVGDLQSDDICIYKMKDPRQGQ